MAEGTRSVVSKPRLVEESIGWLRSFPWLAEALVDAVRKLDGFAGEK